MAGNEDKAKRYIALLDSARANGSWSELPELIRKVTKHAPTKKILIQTATAEHYVASRNVPSSPSIKPSSSSDLNTLASTLEGIRDRTPEDIFQGETCLRWAQWLGVSGIASSTIPELDISSAVHLRGAKGTSLWTKICLVKSVYLQSTSLLDASRIDDAQGAFTMTTAWMANNKQIIGSSPQLSYWSEQLLAQHAYMDSGKNDHSSGDRNVLELWSSLATNNREVSPSVYGHSRKRLERSSIWKQYYHSLSRTLQDRKLENLDGNQRLKVAAELRKVEAAYEIDLLQTHKSPKASESNAPIEGWVEQVISNWQTLCGPNWHDADLGQGGRNAATRNVLDILYRAASKTFHSTLILRRLFQVHKALAEFDLAYRCLDTYMELTERARERAAKSNVPAVGQDKDETVLLLLAEGIDGLCSFGKQTEARKAYEIAMKIEDWLDTLTPEPAPQEMGFSGRADPSQTNELQSLPDWPHQTLETLYRAIGIAKAHWASWTPFSEIRSELHAEALIDLQRAYTFTHPQLETAYALAMLLSQTRHIDQAVQCVKEALGSERSSTYSDQSWLEQRKLLALWHLLSLLLTSRQDFDTAGRSCDAAWEQFPSVDVLLGATQHPSDLDSTEKTITNMQTGLIKDMESDELQRILEIQLTQLAITEVLEGPEHALNSSNDILSLYSRLFGHFESVAPRTLTSTTLGPPKSSAGTVKSIRGSLFGRKKVTPSVAQSSARKSDGASKVSGTSRPGTQATEAPSIQVTDESGKPSPQKSHRFHHSHEEKHHEHHHHINRHSSKVTQRLKGSQVSQDTSSHADSFQTTREIPVENGNPNGKLNLVNGSDSLVAVKHDSNPESKQPLEAIPHNNTNHGALPPPAGHDNQPPEQDVRLPTLHPYTSSTTPTSRFAKAAAEKHALAVLTKIWLIIATLYRRALMFDDSKEACGEAAKIAFQIETLTTTMAAEAPSKSLSEPGWGGTGKSSDEIFADVYCERAELLTTIAERRRNEKQTGNGDDFREAVEQYEKCLMYYPDHAGGIIGLSKLLLDYYEKKLELGKKVDDGKSYRTPSPQDVHQHRQQHQHGTGDVPNGHIHAHAQAGIHAPSSTDDDLRKTPENLNRIAARDRAYGLLSGLTKLGTSWDNSEAWFGLARAHELGGEVEKAKNILWWCIELEDTRPIRHWRNVSCTGYVL